MILRAVSMVEEQYRNYQKMLALLEAALNNTPDGRDVREELVREHNQRIPECESIFGESLKEFRIHDSDLQHTATIYVRGIGSRPLSSARVCDMVIPIEPTSERSEAKMVSAPVAARYPPEVP